LVEGKVGRILKIKGAKEQWPSLLKRKNQHQSTVFFVKKYNLTVILLYQFLTIMHQ
jgi:hypothetical protein